MPALYFSLLYARLRDSPPEAIVRKSISALLAKGCAFHHATTERVANPEDPPDRRGTEYGEEVHSVERATELAVDDLRDWSIGARAGYPTSLVNLYFRYGFEFDNRGGKNEAAPEEAKEVRLHFMYDPLVAGEHDVGSIQFDTWEEYVLLYGRKETHQANMRRIVALTEAVYDAVHPFFGFMETEHGDWDESTKLLASGRLPVGNHFVFVGPTTLPRIDLEELRTAGHPWRRLSDGGIVIQHRFSVEGDTNYLSR